VLETLRDLPADCEAVRAWAAQYGLDDVWFVATAVETHAYWAAHPAKRATRMLRCPTVSLFASSGPDLPESRTRAAALFPIPAGEPFAWWLERAEIVIKECKGDLAARYPKSWREPETARHFEWFVEVQVCGRSPRKSP
jgi:hypothetical protein